MCRSQDIAISVFQNPGGTQKQKNLDVDLNHMKQLFWKVNILCWKLVFYPLYKQKVKFTQLYDVVMVQFLM